MAMTRKKVLWVDDEIEFLRSHIMFLETRGYSVTPVFNGDDALHILREQPSNFDIVLLDEQMPGKDGLTTLEEIKEFLPDLPVVMVTKSEEEQVMEEALGRKIDGYLTKPVNPSQILSVCKKLLDSKQIISAQIMQRFVRTYSEMRMALKGNLDAARWMSLYDTLMRWDIELEKVDDEGIRQAHSGQKSDANAQFCGYCTEHYIRWINGDDAPPIFTPQVVAKHIAPLVSRNEKVYFIVFDTMRLDQYLAIEPLLRQHFNVERHTYMSILPSTSHYTRPALYGGAFPADIEREYGACPPDIDTSDTEEVRLYEEKLLNNALARCGVSDNLRATHVILGDMAESQDFLGTLDKYENKPLVSVAVNFLDLLAQSRTTTTVLQEIAPDETALRRFTHSWFQYSTIYHILGELARQKCTVVLTATNGSILCSRGSEIYGVSELGVNRRYRFGENITSDERYSVYVAEPHRFKLPQATPATCGIILRENYYFIQHDRFENYQKQYKSSFQNGGVSLDEMVVPLSVLRPR